MSEVCGRQHRKGAIVRCIENTDFIKSKKNNISSEMNIFRKIRTKKDWSEHDIDNNKFQKGGNGWTETMEWQTSGGFLSVRGHK